MASNKVWSSYLVVLGCGQVGRALLEMVNAGKVSCSRNNKLVQVLAVFDSKHGIVGEEKAGAASSPAALPSHVLKEIIRAKEEKRSLESMKQEDGIFSVDSNEKAWGDVVAKMASDHPSLANVVVADCTANETGHVLKEALDKEMGVVLANKKPISGPQAAFEYFMQCDPFFRWESTVGAGSPFITTFKRLVAGGDKVKKVSGVFSGTLGYVMTGLEDGKPLSDVVTEAKALGYTEPDPRDDLSGVDFSRKALILARMMGWKLELSDIQLESMVPEDCSQEAMSLDDFMSKGLKMLDASFSSKVQEAKQKGQVLRYAATIEGGACKVGLVTVSKDTPLGRLRGTDNILEIHSEIYSPSPLVVQGAGAGPECTALGVLADAAEVFNAKGVLLEQK